MKRTIIGVGIGIAAAFPALARDLVFPISEGPFDWRSYEEFADAHDYAGETVSINATWTGQDKALFESVLAYFEEATGAEVLYSGSDNLAQDIVVRTVGGSPPNIAVIPQPGLVADLARRGYLSPQAEGTAEWVRENYAAGDSWVDLGTYEGPDGEEDLYGLFYRANVTSLVWYSPEQFEEAGYEVPQSMEELRELTSRIAEEGQTPWCIGLGAGPATGWPGTDWVEDLLLRTQPTEVYDAWVRNEVPFDDPAVIDAMEEFGWFAHNDAFVAGGSASVPTTDWRDAASGIFEFPPDCYMMKQPSFVPSFFPEGVVAGRDYDFFYFPAYASKDLGKPVLGSATQVTITKDSPAARAFVEFLKTPIGHEIWMGQSGLLSPHLGASPEVFPTELQRELNEVLLEATSFSFDGSDQMPPEIGADAFWSGMTDYAGGKPAKDVAAEIQARWETVR